MVKHLHRACTGYREWKVAVAQAFQGSFVSTTKSADHDAVVRAYAAVDPDNRKQVRFTVLERMLMALYRDGHLEASWGMLKDIFPELQVRFA